MSLALTYARSWENESRLHNEQRFPEGINNLGEIATPFALFDKDGHVALTKFCLLSIRAVGVILEQGEIGLKQIRPESIRCRLAGLATPQLRA
jgi:hypothetical protein